MSILYIEINQISLGKDGDHIPKYEGGFCKEKKYLRNSKNLSICHRKHDEVEK